MNKKKKYFNKIKLRFQQHLIDPQDKNILQEDKEYNNIQHMYH